MSPDHTFYGGDTPGAQENISGGTYVGPGLGPIVEWKCPRCSGVNTGDLADGCTSCGSGAAKAFNAGLPRAEHHGQGARRAESLSVGARGGSTPAIAFAIAETWAEAHPQATLAEAFVAGYELALQRTVQQTPPVAADVIALAPEGKPRRTIIAALDYFRTQVLPSAGEEMASGEWCSATEIDELIRQLKTEEGLL